jgi:hypothetical protein
MNDQNRPRSVSLPLADDGEKERRKKLDPVGHAYRAAAFGAWLIFILGVLLLGMAGPTQRNFFTEILDLTVISVLDRSLLYTVFVLMTGNVLLCALGLYLNSKRMRRRGDRYSRSLVVFLVLSTGCAAALPFFW